MTEFTKQDILNAIQTTAKENGSAPLGRERFIKETDISEYQLNKFWRRWSEAQQEAGFEPNTLNAAHDIDFLKESMVSLIRELDRFPTSPDLRLKRHQDHNFPDQKTFDRLGKKKEKVQKVMEYAEQNGYSDVVSICAPILEQQLVNGNDEVGSGEIVGEVYLFKSGRYYKIGKTSDTVRQGTELRIQLPEKLDLIHSIKTDDPSGVETYWHRRFESKRMNGEWFDLNSSDLKAFKRWRKIV